MTKRTRWSAILVTFLLVVVTAIGAQSAISPAATTRPEDKLINAAYPRNERIVYELSWFSMKAADIILTVTGKDNGRWHILVEVKSSPFLSFFYPMNDRFETEITGPDMLPEWITAEQRKGNRRTLKSSVFDQNALKVVYKKDKDAPKVFGIPRPSHNEISSFFILRTLPMNVGQSVFVETFAAKKSHTVEVKILERERCNTALGEVETIKVKPELPFEPIKKQRGSFYIWFTEDDRRIPVKIEGTIRRGPLSAELKEWTVLGSSEYAGNTVR